MKLLIILMVFISSSFAFADPLSDYKEKVKSNNINAFYEKENSYTINEIIDALLGVDGAVPIGTIRSKINKIKSAKEVKKAEINSATSIEEIDRILGSMTHN